VPVELTETACDTGEFRTTLPKLIDVEFTLTADVPVFVEGDRAMLKLALCPPDCAVMIAVWLVVTAATVALNPAFVVPRLTVTWLGTVTAGLLLESATYVLVLVVDVRLTEQASVPGPL
jgi:hypothetical protein